jgi:peptidyl-dipeptidase A
LPRLMHKGGKMLLRMPVSVFMLVFLFAGSFSGVKTEDEAGFEKWISEDYLPSVGDLMFKEVDASWNYETNLTDHNKQIMIQASAETANFTQVMSAQMKKLFLTVKFTKPENNRLYRKLSMIGDAALSAEKYKELLSLKANMSNIYSTATVCGLLNTPLSECPPDKKWNLEPGITQALDNPNTPEPLLAQLWKSWRDESGKKMRDDYIRYVKLKNEAAAANGFPTAAEVWRAPYVEPDFNYTDADFLNDAKKLFEQTKPLYEQLHAYVRAKLRERHGNIGSSADGPIPAHLLGNMWAQSWLGTLNFTQLFPSKPKLDVTEEMKTQNYTAKKMFEIADKFFTDLGLEAMPAKFWDKSMITKPEGREVTCHASAWDFYNAQDFRIKQCTDITMQDLFTVHHEMGHVEYFLQYKNNSIPFREGANDGFHEAIGDVLALSVSTPTHLKGLNLIRSDLVNDNETDLNFQFSTALEKIAFIPFGLMLDLYRYDVFSGTIKPDELNKKWWEYAVEYQGICAPDNSRDETNFDPGAKFHVPADVPYMRYFVSFIIQFQFHKALCDKAGHQGPLYTCDINNNKEAGKLLGEALKLGSTKPWQEAMQKITGTTTMDAGPLLEFFQPLYEYLVQQNNMTNNPVGWTKVPYCPSGSMHLSSSLRIVSLCLFFYLVGLFHN